MYEKMAVDTSEVLDLSKENIQPLRQGRKALHLKTALQAQVDPETQQLLLRKREEYEYMIRMYEGDDPLQPYYNYVIWLEQSFPKMGRENNVIQLLEDALIKFKDVDKYKQDHRLIQLLIKYLGVQSNSLELYKLVYDQGLGTMCAALYKAWAEEYEKVNDIKRADEIYKLGIRCRAQPLSELENAHVQFQLSVARRMIDGSLIPDTHVESSRTVLSKLKPSSVKSNCRISRDSAGVHPSLKTDAVLKNNNSHSLKFQVYQEDGHNNSQEHGLKNEERFPRGSVSNRENTLQAGKWCGQKQKQKHKLSMIPSTPFHVHEDPEAAYSNIKTDFRPRALKSRKDEFNPPVAVFEPPDPTRKPMYPKQLVYVGGRDMQLEEIRAAHYWKNLERNSRVDDEMLELENNDSNTHCTSKYVNMLTEETEVVNPKNIPASQSKSNNCFTFLNHSPSTSMTVNTRAAMNIIQQMWESPLSQDTKTVRSCFELPSQKVTFPVYTDTSAIQQSKSPFSVFYDETSSKTLNPFEVYADYSAKGIERMALKSSPLSSNNIRTYPDSVKSTFQLICDENTPNENPRKSFKFDFETPISVPPKMTRKALTLNAEENVDSRLRDNASNAQSSATKVNTFFVFCDENSLENNGRARSTSKNYRADPNNEDEELARPMYSNELNAGIVNAINTPLPLIIPVNLQDTPLEPENKENQPPQDYASPIERERRPLSGILTPATNVPIEEQRSDDSDDDDEGNRLGVRPLDMDEDTCTTRTFDVPLPTSTPFSRSNEGRIPTRPVNAVL